MAGTAGTSTGVVRNAETARQHLSEALRIANLGGIRLTHAQADEIVTHLEAADGVLGEAARALANDPFLWPLRPLPWIGTQLRSAETIVEAGRRLTARNADVASLLAGLIDARAAGSSRDQVAAVARLMGDDQPEIAALGRAFDEADRLIAAVPSTGLLPPLADARSSFAGQLGSVQPWLNGLRVAAKLLPDALGVPEPRRYLLLALDNAEIRPIGGLIAAVATPTAADGHVRGLDFRDVLSIDRKDQEVYVRPPGPLADHLLGGFTWQLADAGWWPDLERNASEVQRLYRVETGDGDIDGVVAFTPEFVDALLAVVGPVDVPQADITVHAGETYLVSLEQAEVANQGEGRKAFLAELATAILDRLFLLEPQRYPELVEILDQAVRQRHLQIYLDDPALQSLLAEAGWYDPFSFPTTGDRLSILEANVAPVSKLNILVDMDHSLDVRLQPDGSAFEVLRTRYTNRFDSVLPRALHRVRSSFLSGNLGSYQRRYLHPDATVLSVSNDDPQAPITDPEALEVDAGCLVVGNYQLIRPGVTHLETRFTVLGVVESAEAPASSGRYRLTFRKQVGRDDDGLTVRVSAPPGTVPTRWSEGGTSDGFTVTFVTTTADDRVIEVEYARR